MLIATASPVGSAGNAVIEALSRAAKSCALLIFICERDIQGIPRLVDPWLGGANPRRPSHVSLTLRLVLGNLPRATEIPE